MEDREHLLENECEEHQLNFKQVFHTGIPKASQRTCWQVLWQGPKTPKSPRVTPWWPRIQIFPKKLRAYLPIYTYWLFFALTLLSWFALNAFLVNRGIFDLPEVGGHKNVQYLTCDRNADLWKGPNADCGLNGQNCKGAALSKIVYFKCPANCVRESWVYRPMPVGNYVAYHEPFVVGGTNLTYRGDSSICAAALHSGLLSNKMGGCGSVEYIGPQKSFIGSKGQNSIKSFDFDTEFLSSYRFMPPSTCTGCRDTRIPIILINFCFVFMLAYLVHSPLMLVYTVVIIGFWTVILASNPPWIGGSSVANSEIISQGFKRLLPCLLGTFFIYELSCKPLLTNMHAYLSRALFWGVAFYIGILENYVFGAIPVDRLTLHDLNTQAGAWIAVLVIGALVLLIAIGQAYLFWRMNKIWPYLGAYLSALGCLTILSMIPNQTLRIHHYILALILLPGTCLQTTASLFYQGLLLGLYVAGIARWDFDSILQTTPQLSRGGPTDNDVVTSFLEPIIAGSALRSVVLRWKPLSECSIPVEKSNLWTGFSLVINDIERYRGADTSFNLTEWAFNLFQSEIPTLYYVRVAIAALNENLTSAFTLSGRIDLQTGEWVPPLPGIV